MLKYRSLKGYKYLLTEAYALETEICPTRAIETKYISLELNGLMCIYPYYAWDGPSGPTIDTESFMRGSLVHDALYQLIREKRLDYSYKDLADNILWKLCIEDGMYRWRALYVFNAVRVFGRFAIKPLSFWRKK